METEAQTKKWFSYKKKNVYFIKYLSSIWKLLTFPFKYETYNNNKPYTRFKHIKTQIYHVSIPKILFI